MEIVLTLLAVMATLAFLVGLVAMLWVFRLTGGLSAAIASHAAAAGTRLTSWRPGRGLVPGTEEGWSMDAELFLARDRLVVDRILQVMPSWGGFMSRAVRWKLKRSLGFVKESLRTFLADKGVSEVDKPLLAEWALGLGIGILLEPSVRWVRLVVSTVTGMLGALAALLFLALYLWKV